ncbi:MAG: hypothetical protein JW857_06670 [Bacteroidales bacterium]|nr:hypothetical protein [Bacteroidales bacterium]
MKRKTIGALLCGFLFIGQSFGQLNEFDLAKYKFPDYKRKALDFNFNLNAQNNYLKNTIENSLYEKRNSTYLSNSLYANYQSITNSQKFQQSLSATLNLSLSKTHGDREILDPSETNAFSFSPSLYLNSVNRMYLKNLEFFEVNPNFIYRYSYYTYNSEQESLPDNEYDHNNDEIFIKLSFKFGFGRIEPVSDARQAIYILEGLQKQKNIAKELTNKDVFEFAHLISKIKNKRYFDARLRKIYELETIANYLDSNHIVSESNIKYFTTLADFWDYGDRVYRSSGTRIAFVLMPGYYLNDDKTDSNEESEENKIRSAQLYTGLEFKYEKPIDLKWQNSIDISSYYGCVNVKQTNTIDDPLEKISDIPNLQVKFAQSIGFYPNTRTDLTFSYSFLYYQFFDKTDSTQDIYGIGNNGIEGLAQLAVNYYISPQFKVNFIYSLDYRKRSSDSSTNAIYDYNYNLFLADNNYLNLINGDRDLKEINQTLKISLLYSLF